nr:MAG TPA: hypothetical protein [Caudoviricetes sp.]
MKTYIVAIQGQEKDFPLFETDSLKVAKAWATRNRYYHWRLTVPCIYIRLLDGRVELAAVGEYNRHTHRTKWTEVY